MAITQSVEDYNRRGFILSASIFVSVSLVPAALLVWLCLHTHNFRDVSANPMVAAEVFFNFFSMLTGFLLSSAFIGKAAAPFIKARQGLRLLSLSVLLGLIWSLLTLSVGLATLALHGFISHDFTWLRNAFVLDELLSGLISLPILLHIPLSLLSVFLVKRLAFRPRITA